MLRHLLTYHQGQLSLAGRPSARRLKRCAQAPGCFGSNFRVIRVSVRLSVSFPLAAAERYGARFIHINPNAVVMMYRGECQLRSRPSWPIYSVSLSGNPADPPADAGALPARMRQSRRLKLRYSGCPMKETDMVQSKKSDPRRCFISSQWQF
jgi:hypothetical protein